MRIGFGYDVHPLVEGRELWLGGIRIEHPYGLMGHSDADVLIHAICDALLGAANLRDIGVNFPDTDVAFKGLNSKFFLLHAMTMIKSAGYRFGNIDATIVAEQPKIQPYIPEMKKTLAEIMKVSVNDISLKATTTEKLGFTGRGEGIAAYVVALLENL
jgi:2-C-methyl-D-erythritol 2,4-cyclodiphosphate synthase